MNDQEIQAQITAAVEVAMKARNGTPKTVYEFMMEAARSFGVPTVLLLVMMMIIYQTVPGWINANIETQNSLTKNLGIQTDNMKALGGTLESLQKYGRETELFRKEVSVDHIAMANELHQVKTVSDTVLVEQVRQREEHKAIMETQQETVKTLKTICESFKKPIQ